MMTWGKEWWPAFLIVCAVWIIVGFGIPELIALFTSVSTHTDNTLSHYAQSELHVSSQMTVHTVAWWLTLIVWTSVVTILTWHIWFGLGG